jgi:hypothetical protein
MPEVRGIPDRVRVALPVLLAARLAQVVRVVLGAQHQLLQQAVGRAVAEQRVGDVERERR